MNNFKKRLTERGYPINFVENVFSEVNRKEENNPSLKKRTYMDLAFGYTIPSSSA